MTEARFRGPIGSKQAPWAMKTNKAKKISPARKIALEVLRRVEAEGAYANLCLNHALQRNQTIDRRDRALATELVYGTLRWRRKLDYALAAYSHRAPDRIEPTLLRILRLSAYQLLFLDRVPAWAVVDEGTELSVMLRGRRTAGFVNGVLRALARNFEHIEWPDPKVDEVRALAINYSFPNWMVTRWLNELGSERCVALLQACNRPPPLWVRVNTQRITAPGLSGLLSAAGYNVSENAWLANALQLKGIGDVTSLAAHQTGLFHVQDAAAQVVCRLLDPRPGERVLDACGAPGGKTATIAQLMKDEGQIVSVDVHPARVALTKQLLERLGIGCVKRLALDLNQSLPEPENPFDRVLLDAPCSSMGVLRRHPESKWRLAPGDLAHLAETQYRLLGKVASLIKPGGTLVYSVCSFCEEEGAGIIRTFLADHPEFELFDVRDGKRATWHKLLSNDGSLATWPDLHEMDAFYAARLQKK